MHPWGAHSNKTNSQGATLVEFFLKPYIIKLMANNPKFETGGIYHIFNRGVEKRDTYIDDSDRFRFIYSLYECNDENAVVMQERIKERIKRNSQGATLDTLGNKERELLVEILAFTLMPNHYHLIVRQLVDGGISFMKKLGNAYVPYFNYRHERKRNGFFCFKEDLKLFMLKQQNNLSILSGMFTNL